MMKLFSRVENLCAAGLIIFFFFPWVNIGGFISISGYQIPDIVKGLGHFAAALGGETGQTDPRIYLFYLIYLIPLFSVLTLIASITNQRTKLISSAAGLAPLAVLAYTLSKMGTAVFQGMAIGAYLTMATAVVMILAALDLVKMPGQDQVPSTFTDASSLHVSVAPQQVNLPTEEPCVSPPEQVHSRLQG